MFGEEESESPRMPSPWEAITAGTTPSLSHCSTPLSFSSRAIRNLNGGSDGDGSDSNIDGAQLSAHDTTVYLDQEMSRLRSQPKLVPEVEEGNVEYKLKLISPTPQRFTRLVTQLKYRLLEGGGQALYEIGVSDDGQLIGLTRKDLDESLVTLDRMAGELGATVVVLKEIELPELLKGTERLRRRAAAVVLDAEKAGIRPKQGKKNKGMAISTLKKGLGSPLLNVATVVTNNTGSSTLAIPSLSDFSTNPTVSSSPEAPMMPGASDSTFPMPIIRNYPYGMRPYGFGRTGLSLGTKASECLDESSSNQPSSFEDPTDVLVGLGDLGIDNHESISQTVITDSDDAFGFGFDLEISSFAKSNLSPLAPSPHVKPIKTRSKVKTHFISSSLHSSSLVAHLPPIKPKKAIVLYPPIKDPAQRATEKRMKRDRRRNQHVAVVPKDSDIRLKLALKDSTDEPHALVAKVACDAALPTADSPVDETRIIAEALVVRKLAMEEAFLDFGGFALTASGPEDGSDLPFLDADPIPDFLQTV